MADKAVLRDKNFRLGYIHGGIEAKNKESEAQIQRKVFLSQRLQVWETREKKTKIRLIGYEVPLIQKTSRGKCVDLLGYDANKNLYVIELKKRKSNESLEEVIEQVNDYAEIVSSIKEGIAKEFRKEFFYEVNFKDIKKLILAPKSFYGRKKIDPNKIDKTVWYGYFRSNYFEKNRDKWGVVEMVGVSLIRRFPNFK